MATIAVVTCGALGIGAPQALASGVVAGFTVTPGSDQAGGDPDVSEDLAFDYTGQPASDSVKDVTFMLAPGLLPAIANVPATCSPAQLDADMCPAGSQVGTGSVKTPGIHAAALYLMPPPSPADLAGVGEVIVGTSVRGTGAFDLSTNANGQPVGELTLGIPNPAQVTEISATINGTTTDGKAFTRLPTSCSAALTSVSVDTYDGGAGAGTSSFTPSGCSSLTYAPSLSVAQVIRDSSDDGAELVTSISQPNAASDAATKALELDPSGLSLNTAADAQCLAGAPCTIGSATATSPLVASSNLSGGSVMLGGSLAAPALTITFPAPMAFSISATIDPATGAVTFPNWPDLPLSRLTLDITGPSGAKAFTTTCTPGNMGAKFTPQSGGSTLVGALPIAYQNCPGPESQPPGPGPEPGPPPGPPPPRPLRVSMPSRLVRVVRGRARVRLACSGGDARRACLGMLSLTTRRQVVRRVHHRREVTHETIVLARGAYRVTSGDTRTVVFRLARSGRLLLEGARHRQLSARASVTLRGGAGVRRTVLLRGQ